MTGRQFVIFLSGALITLLLMKPTIPVLAGSALLLLAANAYRSDLCQLSPRKRWAAFKKIAAMAAFGGALAVSGAAFGPVSTKVNPSNVSEIRHIMAYVALCGVSLIGTPSLIWAYLSQRGPLQRKRIRQGTVITTLSSLANARPSRNIKVAV